MRFRNCGIGLIALLSVTTPVNALPGQNLSDVIEWTNNNSLLPRLQPVPVKYEEGYPDYTSETNLGTATLILNVWIDSEGVVEEETLDYRNSQNSASDNLEFLRDNTGGIALLEKTYGSEIVRDFQAARYVVELELAGKLRFYQGEKYAYETWASGGASNQFTVLPRHVLGERVRNWRRQGAK